MTYFQPSNGTERCRYCGDILDQAHVKHPVADIVVWLWNGDRNWRIVLVIFPVMALVCLTAVIVIVRRLLEI